MVVKHNRSVMRCAMARREPGRGGLDQPVEYFHTVIVRGDAAAD